MNAERTPQASEDAVQDRVTAWPGVPVPQSSLVRLDAFLTPAGAIDLGGSARPYEAKALPNEWFLRELFEVPLDPEGLLHLFSEYGPGCPTGDRAFDLIPAHEKAKSEDLVLAQHYVMSKHSGSNLVVACEVFEMYVRMARALTEHWIGHLNDERDSDIVAAHTRHGFTKPPSIEDAWRRFEDFVNAALRPYQVHVVTGHGLRSTQAACWYSEVILQLANHIAEGAPVTRCANENCRQWFYRQRGRSTTGRHRTKGVDYCSKKCAEAQRQRDRRRTLKETK